MRIVIDARNLLSTTGRYYERTLHYLQQIDNTNQYCLLLSSAGLKHWGSQDHPANFTAHKCDIAYFSLSEQRLLPGIIESFEPDLVHFTFQQKPLLIKSPYILTVFDLTQLNFDNIKPGSNKLIWKSKQKILAASFKKNIKNAKHIITASKYVADEISTKYKVNASKISAVYGGSELTKTTPKPIQKLVGAKYILYVGNAYAHKNINRLVDAYQILIARSPELKLVIAGKIDVFHQQLIDYAKSKDLEGFTHLGFISDEELAWAYSNAAAYIMPSLSEGLGMPGLEAMSYDCPVVSSKATCSPEIYQDAAYYFDPLDIKDMAEKISEVISNKDLQKKLVENGQKLLKKYDYKITAQKTLESYNKVSAEL